MHLDRWVQQERKAAQVRMDHGGPQVMSVGKDVIKGVAICLRCPIVSPTNTDTLRIATRRASRTDMSVSVRCGLANRCGSMLSGSMQTEGVRASARFPQAVAPQGPFRFMLTSPNAAQASPTVARGQTVVCDAVQLARSGLPDDYFQVLLPPSGIFVDATAPVMMMQSDQLARYVR